ncbi:hypothetical protein [Streptomyces sp. H39-S7]|uniref:hypothetical protein n=1 Tax=Streptomyces sp. H39-S7 TaxID=3004357 RepID=UPI0022AECD9A|nr:hypothetical protein [Streptomyces sp. H39-S7]MCZ4119009.1 hypothetical protein [Streptomyces sp. H39-S7]
MRAEHVPTSVTQTVYSIPDWLGLPALSQNQLAEIVAVAWDAIAHCLAEEIRSEIASLKLNGVLEPDRDWAASAAADHIDPEVPPF